MKIFLDTAEIDEIRIAARWGCWTASRPTQRSSPRSAKVAMSEQGLEAIARLADEGIKANCTLVFSANQGLLAPRAGASLLSPFVGRLDDITESGMDVVRELVAIVKTHHLDAAVLAASIRHPRHVTAAALTGAHIATVPFKILQQMIHHPLTDSGIVRFRKEWEAVQSPRRPNTLTGAA